MWHFIDLLLQGNIEEMLKLGGVILLLAMVFMENGVIIGVIFPGDILLFTTGVLAAGTDIISMNIWVLSILIILASVLGNIFGFWTWNSMHARIQKKGSFLFVKQHHIEKVQEFYKKYGAKSFLIAKFFPIVRTFLPILAGTAKISFRTFIVYNTIGAILRVFSFVLVGYFLGKKFEFVVNYIEYIVIGIVVLSNITIIYKRISYVIQEKILKRIKLFKTKYATHIANVFSRQRLRSRKLLQMIRKNKFQFQLFQTLKKKPEEFPDEKNTK
jgi:membrane-associated protein